MEIDINEETHLLTVEFTDEEDEKLCNILNVKELTPSIFSEWIERCIGNYLGGTVSKETQDGRGANGS